MAGETKTRLTLLAEALGFDQSARAVDVLTKAQDELAKKSAALEGAKLTGTVAEVEKLRGEQQALGGAIAELTPRQEELNLSTRNFVGLIRQVSPGLAFYVEGLFRSVHVAGELGAKNLELNSILKAGKDFITGNANALALMGAGGLVVLGINAISNAVAKMQQDFERATKAIQDQQKAVNELKRAQQDQQQTIESISDKRREGGLTADQAGAAGQQASAIGKRFRKSISEESINRAEALLGGQGLSQDQMADAAFLMDAGKLELDEKARAESRRRAFDRAMRRYAADVARFRAREGSQAGGVAAGAKQELGGAAAGTLSLEDFIKSLPGDVALGIDPGRLAKIVGGLKGIDRGEVDKAVNARLLSRLMDAFQGDVTGKVGTAPREMAVAEWITELLAEKEGIKGVGAEEIRAAEFIQQQLDKANRNGKGRNVTIDNSTHNYTEAHRKMIVPGQRAREEASMNGAARARAAEE